MSDIHGEKQARPPEPPGFRRLGLALLIAIVISALAVALLFWRHHHRLIAEAQRLQSEVASGPRVFVTEVKEQPGKRSITLPADVRGFFQSTVYAKVAGYVTEMHVDKGDHVKAGQLLAKLSSPELDQQVRAAQADVILKRRTFERYQSLVKREFVSREDYETTRSQYQVSEATLRQVRALEDYETLRAPFTGTITARYVDPGALVPAATGSTSSALPLVDIAELTRLRILVYVQQDAAPYVNVGDAIDITIDQQPDVKITGQVSRFSHALEPRTRTMLCEIWLDNRWDLYPGTFVHVTLHLEARPLPVAPSSAIFIREGKPAAALIRDSRVRFTPVELGLDDGKTVQIVNGLKAGDQVATNLPAELAEGARVQVMKK